MAQRHRPPHRERTGTPGPALEPMEPRLLLDAGPIVINEIMHHPVPYDLGTEYIELYNRGATAVNLAGWEFTAGIDYTLGDVTLGAGGYLVVAADVDAFLAKYTGFGGQVVGGWDGRLSNSREEIVLRSAGGAVQDEVDYADQGDWAVRERGRGVKLAESLTYASGKVTATITAHGYQWGDQVQVYGATDPGYNGTFTITDVTVNTFKYTPTAAPTGPAEGTILCRWLTDQGHAGWVWTQLADGLGSSLELRNAALTNTSGQNWASSTVRDGTPGLANSVASSDIAPLILDVDQDLIVPKAGQPVTVTAEIVDELGAASSATLYWRVDAASPPPFNALAMHDDGTMGDEYAGDGVWTAIIPGQLNNAVIEFYVEAADAGAHSRTWPAPTNIGQAANALYQVDNSYVPPEAWTPGSQPLLKIIMTEAERAELQDIQSSPNDNQSGNDPWAEDDSDAQMNATFISIDTTGQEIRYTIGVRNRGAGSRDDYPYGNYHVNFNTDAAWHDVTAINLNGQYSSDEIVGSAIFRAAGLPAQEAVAVQVRVNGSNLVAGGSYNTYGSYAYLEVENTEMAENHWPLDPSGNYYRGIRDILTNSSQADFRYHGEDPDPYRSDYSKQSNVEDDDWTDLIALCRAFDADETPDPVFLETLLPLIDLEQWLRYFAMEVLLGDDETTLGTGHGDDFAFYRGTLDTRFQLVPHDLDTMLDRGTSQSIWMATALTSINRLLKHPEVAPLYFAQMEDLARTVFAPEVLHPLIDNAVGAYAPPSVVQTMKDRAATYRAYALGQIPQALTAQTGLGQSQGYDHTTAATVNLTGQAPASQTRRVLVNGLEAVYTPWQGTWTTNPGATVALGPGINRITVQALDADGGEVARLYKDVWYEDGSVADVSGTLPTGTTTWTAAGGPYRVTASLTVPAGATLVIEPGASVFFESGTSMTVNGKLLAEGTEYAHIRLTATPGVSSWNGLRFSGGPEPSVIAWAEIDRSSGSDSIDASGTAVHLDHIVWSNVGSQYILDWHSASIILTNSYLPNTGGHETFHFSGFPASGYALVQGNYFGGTTGYNDVIDFTGGNRPGPIAQFIGNVFENGSDDVLDLDGTDAYIAGNVFMHIHQDADRDSKSYCITTGIDGSQTSELTVIGNLFYDVDHPLLVKDNGFIWAVNNTMVDTHKRPDVSGATSAVVSFFEDRSGQGVGLGVYLEGNIICGTERLWENLNSLSSTSVLECKNNVVYGVQSTGEPIPGTGNVLADPRLWNTTGVTDPWTDFRLRPGSPAIGLGPNGVDAGGLAGYLATIAGEPYGTTWRDDFTLTVGGPDIYGYKYRVWMDGGWLGDWSAEVPLDWTVAKKTVSSLVRSGSVATATVAGHGYSNDDIIVLEGAGQREYRGPFTIYNVTADTFDFTVSGEPATPATGTIRCWKPAAGPPAVPPIALVDLAAGEYAVHVIAKNSAGFWQAEAEATVSRPWTVDPAFRQLRLSEVLADNETALLAGGVYPDAVELYYDAPPGSPALSLTGYSLTDNRDLPRKFTFGPGVSIAAGGYLTAYAETNPGGQPGIWLDFGLKADGDDLYLLDPVQTATPLDSVAFGFQLADRSIARRADLSWGLATPTFGGANLALRTGDPSTLVINEWFTDGDVLYLNDYLELYNADPRPVDVGGLHLTDVPASAPGMYEVPALSFIAGSGYGLFIADNDPGQGADHTNFRLSPYKGMIALTGADLGLVDQVIYPWQTRDVAQGRSPDGDPGFEFLRLPTPGLANPADFPADTLDLELIAIDGTWWYEQSDQLWPGWYTEAYDPSNPGDGSDWQTGQALLGDEGSALPEPIRTDLDLGPMTFYFRTTFTLDYAPEDVLAFTFDTILDDGMVLYLNGQLVKNYYVNEPIEHSQTASRSVSDATWELGIPLDTTFLRQGENLLAAEVHQASSGSSDIVFGLRLEATVQVSTTDPLQPLYDLMDGLRITEIMYDPPGSGSYEDYEFVELYNAGPHVLDLTGVRIRGGIDYTFTGGTLDPGAYLVVAKSLSAFQSRYGTSIPAVGPYSGRLDNAGEDLRLELPNPYDVAILRFDYDDAWYAPRTADDGRSLVLVDPGAHRRTWRQRNAWRPSSVLGGSPGAADPDPLYPVGAIVISEVLSHTDGADGDWIELYNAYTDPIDLAGWFLSDDSASLHKYEITTEQWGAQTVLEPGEYLVLAQTANFGNGSPDPGRHEYFGLSELGDDLWLTSPTGAYVEVAVFGASDREVTFGRYQTSTGAVDFVSLRAPTRGYINDLPLVGPVVISEIMYHALDDQDEFIELHNITGAPVPLYDPDHPANTWQFTGGVDYAFPEGVVLEAGGYLIVTRSDPAAFRAEFGLPGSVAVYGPFENSSSLENDGETVILSRPGTPEPPSPEFPEGFVPYIVADRVRYSDGQAPGDPWPTPPDGTGPSLERITPADYGNDVANWRSSTLVGGTPGWANGTDPVLPQVTQVVLNPHPSRTLRTVGDIEPSGIGVSEVRVTFSKPVTFALADVTAQRVHFEDTPGGVVEVVDSEITAPILSVAGSGTETMTIAFADAYLNVYNTWVKVTLSGTGTVRDFWSQALDGEPRTDSSGLGYIRDAALDLPSGDGAAGGNAVFYVGSLKGDLWGFASNPKPNGVVNTWDVNGFVTRYQQLSLDADFWGFASNPKPNGTINNWDVNGFVTAYQYAVANDVRLHALPTAPGGLASGDPVPLAASGAATLTTIEPAPFEPASFEPQALPAGTFAAADPSLALGASERPAPDDNGGLAEGFAPAPFEPVSFEPQALPGGTFAADATLAADPVDLLAGPALEVAL